MAERNKPVCRAHEAIDAAFDEIALIHRKMSFHEPESDVGRLNRFGYQRPVEVHPYTWEVLQWALRVAERSEDCFDVAVGRELVEWEFLPRPADASDDPAGSWQDIELRDDDRVEFHPRCGLISVGFQRATRWIGLCGAWKSGT